MTTNYHRNYHRAALSIAAAATSFIAAHAGAQMLGQNIFAGANTGPTSISTTSALIGAGQTNSGPLGPGFTGSVALGAGVISTITETLNVGNNGTLTAGQTGVAGLLGSFSASKPISATFVPNQAYSFALTTTTNAALNLLSGLDVTFSTAGATPATVYDASNGTGLLGIAQVVNLFGGGNTATFNFTAPAGVDTSAPITVTVSGQLAAAALGSTFSLTDGALTAVPEPGTYGAMGVGICALALLRFRRRLARS